MNIQQPTISKVADKETMMAYNEDLDPPPPQYILNMFSSEDLSAQSSSDSAKYKRAQYKARVICSSILSDGESPFIIPEGELVCPAKFVTPKRKTSYWYHEPYDAIHVMLKFKKIVMPSIELIQYNNTMNKFPSRFKGYAFMNPHLLSEQDNQIILDKIEARENINHDEYVEDGNYYNVHSDDSDDDDN